MLGQPQFSSVLEGRVIICILALKHLTISTLSASEFTGPKLGLCFKHCEFVLFCICSDGSAWCSTGTCLDSSWRQGEETRILGFNTSGFELCIPGNSSCSIQVMVVEASKVPAQGSREGKLKLTGQVGFLAAAKLNIHIENSAWICHAGICRACSLLDQVENISEHFPNYS